ncbi:glycosyl hydrolase family 17 protein [Glaciecola petra]|uniref:Endo-1,3-beta-glucanase btgC n=1 Tax=Glaciecola petra TaxID=3075602 RepID=A0ABU2ZQP5_9ALTE|nr:glycosyl hydrolase family 17 protein [Aestuariibacter sp. P117]MDT0594654.1 glycosyl hydrolase family 17 protein [Aestuariibacter sp. P117]
MSGLSSLYKKTLSLSGVDTNGRSIEDLKALVRETLSNKIHGISFSPYVEGQGPGTIISPEQIRERLSPIQSSVNWIRSFSCTEGNEHTPAIAKELGLKTMVGVWLEDNNENNEKELQAGIKLAQAGVVDILAVGNEVMLRGEMTEDELVDYIERAKAAAPGVMVGYVDAYFKFVDHPKVTEACDVILANCYPFWESCPAEHALLYMKEMYRIATKAANGKPVVISETGWPNVGTPEGGAVPSYDNAVRYFLNTYKWAQEENIDIVYFSSFDEAWKIEEEGDVGAYWGLWDKDGIPKYV